jgi:hypothetical protein
MVKSGWAAVVLLTGSPKSPRVADSRRIELSDPDNPDSRQPYHATFATARSRGPELSGLLRSVRRFGTQSVTAVIRDYRANGHTLEGAGVIVGSTIDPERIANEHIRIHALEGKLFREVVEKATTAGGLTCSVWRDRDLYQVVTDALRQGEPRVRDTVAAMGRGVAGSWRAEQKAATLAAWAVLAIRGRADAP